MARKVGNVYWKMSSDSAIRQHTTKAYRWVTISQTVLRCEDDKSKPPRVRSRLRGLGKVVLWLHRNSMSQNESIIYNTQTTVAANFDTNLRI